MTVRGGGAELRADPRSKRYPAREIVPSGASGKRTYDIAAILKQKRLECVGFSCFNWLTADRRYRASWLRERGLTPVELYGRAQERDPELGQRDPMRGTQLEHGLEVLREESLVNEYRWIDGASGFPDYEAKAAQAVDELVGGILEIAPVIVCSPWWDSMDRAPDRSGFLRLDRSKPSAYGHAYLLYGVDTEAPKPFAWIENSLGREWGIFVKRQQIQRKGFIENRIIRSGTAKISLDDLGYLFRFDTRAALPIS